MKRRPIVRRPANFNAHNGPQWRRGRAPKSRPTKKPVGLFRPSSAQGHTPHHRLIPTKAGPSLAASWFLSDFSATLQKFRCAPNCMPVLNSSLIQPPSQKTSSPSIRFCKIDHDGFLHSTTVHGGAELCGSSHGSLMARVYERRARKKDP